MKKGIQLVVIFFIVCNVLYLKSQLVQAIANANKNNLISYTQVPSLHTTPLTSPVNIKDVTQLRELPQHDVRMAYVADEYLTVYALRDQNNALLPDNQQDIVLSSDGNGGYIADVYTWKGFFEALWDPANPQWNFNAQDSDAWKKFTGAALGTNLNVESPTYATNLILPVSKIHRINLKNSLDIRDLPDDVATAYYFNRPRTQDISGSGEEARKSYSYKYIHIRHDDLIIDGKQYSINMGYNNFALSGHHDRQLEPVATQPYKENWTVENLDIYGTSWWGFISCNTGLATNYDLANTEPKNPNDVDYDPNTDPANNDKIQTAKAGLNGGYSWITYRDVNYTGSQFSWTGSQTSGITIAGTVNVRSVYSYLIPGDSYQWITKNLGITGNQQNFEVDRVIFAKDCHYTGYTFNGQCLYLTGKATFENGSVVNLYPHGDSPESPGGMNSPNQLGMAWGIYMAAQNNGLVPEIEMNGSAQLNIHCNNDDINDPNLNHAAAAKQPCGAIDMASSPSLLVYNNIKDSKPGEINIDSGLGNDQSSNAGAILKNNPLVNFVGGTANLSHGKFSIKAYNLGDYNTPENGGLMAVGPDMSIDVRTGGDFNLEVADKNHSSDKPLNLLYSANTMKVNIVNPKNVTLDLRNDPCPNSALVYVNTGTIISVGSVPGLPSEVKVPNGIKLPNGKIVSNSTLVAGISGADINAYDTKIRAEGDNGLINGSNGEIIGYPTTSSEYGNVSVGMYGQPPIRVQRVTLPFAHNLLAPMLYLNGSKVIQAPKYELDVLKEAMVKMFGKEFRYINLSDLPGPSLILDRPSNVIYPSRDDWNISATSGGDEWEDYTNDTQYDEFHPAPPQIRVQVCRDDKSTIDLGDFKNIDDDDYRQYEATQKADSSLIGPTAENVNPVTPNILDDNLGNLSLFANDDQGNKIANPNLGKPLERYQQPTAADFDKLYPKYLSDKEVTWDNGQWNPNLSGPGALEGFRHKVQYNLRDLLDKYNKQHPQAPLHLKATDQIKTSAVTNFQSSPLSITFVRNLSMKIDNDQSFLLGDDIAIPFQYYDGDDRSKSDGGPDAITLSGQTKNNSTPITTTIKPLNIRKVTKTRWNIGKATIVGKHSFTFIGQDNASPNNRAYDENQRNKKADGDTFIWNYEVLNLPAYNVVQKITNNPYGTDKNGHQKILNGSYNLVTTYTPKANAPVHSVMFGHESTSDTPNWSNSGTGQITASYTDASGKTITATKPVAADPQKVYDPSYFGWDSSMKAFPAGIQFTIKRTIKVEATKNTPVTIGPDTIISKAADGTTQELGRSDGLNFNSVGSVVLNVPTSIDYGKKHLNFAGEIASKTAKGELSIFNDTADKQKILLTAEITDSSQDSNQLFSNFLDYKYKDPKTNTISYDNITKFKYDNSSFPADHKLLLWKPGGSDNIMEPVLKIPKPLSTSNLGKHQATLTWTMTLGPN
ncbi:hypothetical protein DS830_06735 [Bombilactobacillus bombi]|uniref:hypothetical protein n=1 Tax=Bombilactobacillus bombi TaxID=1303590 RepID=UPI000E5756CE|nr:hypothetical protein [Bombilactobacillus bombi]AXX65186.1 hypothetical protein DS830_06735 [Bombilactobacillus bombi]